MTVAAPTQKNEWFLTWYERYSSDFPIEEPPGESGFNQKAGVFQTETTAYNGQICQVWGLLPFYISQGVLSNPDFCTGYCNPCNVGCHMAQYNMQDIRAGWRHNEVRLKVDGNAFIQMGQDNTWSADGNCAGPIFAAPRSWSIGGFLRWYDAGSVYHTCDNAWRYFDDIYADNTFSRVVLANNQNYNQATIIEPQIPQAWSGGSISVEANLGKFPDSGTAYLFVFDSANTHNPVGYPVALGAAQSCTSQGYYCCFSGYTCSQPRSGSGCTGTCCASSGACSPPASCGDGTCSSGETCAADRCCNGVSYTSAQVCCSGSVYTGNCCSSSDCTSPQVCTSHVCTNPPECEQDVDNDQYGTGPSCLGTDCNDNNPSVHQNITCPYNGAQCGTFSLCVQSCTSPPAETCTNSIDDDCDSLTDCSDPGCSGNPACPVAANNTCGAACSGGAPAGCTNRILADSCAPSGNCDGTNDVEDIILPSSAIGAGSTVQVQVQYECWLGSGGDGVAIWYHNTTAWKLVASWEEAQLTGCDTVNDGPDGTVTSTFTVDNATGTHYIRAVELVPDTNRATSPCPVMNWGDIDDLAFSVAGFHRSDNNPADGCVSDLELFAFIDLWYKDSSNPTLRELMEAIGLWKKGGPCQG